MRSLYRNMIPLAASAVLAVAAFGQEAPPPPPDLMAQEAPMGPGPGAPGGPGFHHMELLGIGGFHGPRNGKAGKGMSADAAPGGPDAIDSAETTNPNVTKESLGTQTLNGISAQGTRFTRLIPAGKIGNDKPITVTREVWYSPDLQMVVQSKHSDPRFGDTVYSLTNIQRAEPAANLFTVPSDFTVKEGALHKGMRGMKHPPMAPPSADAPPAPGL